MSMIKAAQNAQAMNLKGTVEEVYKSEVETVKNALSTPKTKDWRQKALSGVDTLVHAAAAIPFINLVSDLPVLMYGGVKVGAGKLGEMAAGEGGFATDLKNSGHLSVQTAAASLVGHVAGLFVPVVGTVASTAVSSAAHAGAAFVSANRFRGSISSDA